MTFGWQGFRFDHPDDWAPAAVTGNFREGYARIASPSRQAIQIRWQRGKTAALDGVLDAYLRKCERDSKRSRQPFRSERKAEENRILYRWIGHEQARGSIFVDEDCLYFLEVIGARRDSLLPHLQKVLTSFRAADSDTLCWSVFGLCLDLPSEYKLEKHDFVAGRTQLWFSGRSARLECTRWGFAEQLLKKHSLEDWAKAALAMDKGQAMEEGRGLRLRDPRPLSQKEAIVALQAEQNQIVTVKRQSIRKGGGPEWDWLS